MRRGLLLTGLLACAPDVDVVARVTDGGTATVEGGEVDPACSGVTPASTTLVVMTKEEMHRVDIVAKQEVADPGIPCLPLAGLALAVDRHENIWTSTSDGSLVVGRPKTNTCTTFSIGLSISAMAFVWSPTEARETLYVVVDRSLVRIDPATLETRTVGALSIEAVRGLAGTADGRLVAFAGTSLITIAYLSALDASIAASWQVRPPATEGAPLVGGVVTWSGLELVFGLRAYAFAPAKGTLSLHTWLLEDRGQHVTAIGGSSCVTIE
jgi:hypothetical protein